MAASSVTLRDIISEARFSRNKRQATSRTKLHGIYRAVMLFTTAASELSW